MLDIQAVYFRDVAPVLRFDFVSMARVTGVNTVDILQVDVNGIESPHLVLGPRTIAVAVPDDKPYSSVHSVQLIYGGIDAGTELVVPDGSRVSQDTTILRLSGEDFSSAVDVRVQNKSQPFVVTSKTTILTSYPETVTANEFATNFTIDVIVSSTTIRRRTFFTYMLGEQLRPVTGAYKATQQFIRVLLTTPGTDIFDPDGPAGNLQQWQKTQISSTAQSALAAKVILSLSLTFAKYVIASQESNVPPEEQITAINVVDIAFDTPGGLTLALKLQTAKNQIQLFSLLLDSVKNAIAGTING